MKQNITIKPELKIKQTFNAQTKKSLKILSLNKQDLMEYIHEVSKSNPYLSIEENNTLNYVSAQESLYDHFKQELFMTNQNVKEEILIQLLSIIDSNGYFKEKPESTNEINKSIYILQRLEPKGCFSKNLKECLSIQCEDQPTSHLLCDYLNELAENNYDKIIQETNLSKKEIQNAYLSIQALNPKPAATFSKYAYYVLPEIKIKDDLTLEYQDLQIHFEDIQQTNDKLKELRLEAKQLFTNLEKRKMTLIQIMSVLCDIQKDYLLENKPLCHCTLEIVGKQCNLHPSTISRAIHQKSFEYKNKYYPISSLFCHSNDIFMKQKIQEIINQEDVSHPYSDEKIRKLLEKQNIHLSRRTIQKYREQMHIQSSIHRKR